MRKLITFSLAFAFGWLLGGLLTPEPVSIVELRQVARDADEEIDRLNEQLTDERWLAAREISDLQEERLRLHSLLPEVTKPCYFPDLATQ